MTSNPQQVRAPARLSRSEKLAFNRIILMRNAAQRPVNAGEIDLIADFISTRSRIDQIQMILDRTTTKLRGHGPDEANYMAYSRQLDATIGKAHRMAEKLGLIRLNGESK